MKKRLFSFLLALCMIVSVFPVTAWATETGETIVPQTGDGAIELPEDVFDETEPEVTEAEETVAVEAADETAAETVEEGIEPRSTTYPITGECGLGVKWSLSKDGTLTISGKGKMKNYMNALGSQPWPANVDIKKVVIKSGITHIGDYAFYYIPELESVSIPDTVTSIGDAAFASSFGITKISLPSGLTSVGASAFKGTSITSIVFPSGVTEIPAGVCSDCTKLKTVTIKGKVTDIGGSSFANCTALKSVSIAGAAKDTEIGNNAFSETGLESFVVPEGVYSIGEYAFSECASLASITLPESLSNIYDRAFTDCISLTSVEIPKSVDYMPYGVFFDCINLKKVTVYTEAVEHMAESTFWGCESLQSVHIIGNEPQVEEEVEELLFRNGTDDLTVYYDAGTSGWGKTFCGQPTAVWGAADEPEEPTKPLEAPIVTVSRLSTGKIRLSWAKITGAVKYEIYRADSDRGPFSLKYTTSGTQYTNTGAEAGETWYYHVVAVGENGETARSENVYGVTTLGTPSMKIGNVASSGKIRLSWEAVPGAVKYEIFRADSKEGNYSLQFTTTKTTYTNTGAKAGQSWWYKVIAIAEHPHGNSAFSTPKGRVCDLPRPVVSIGNDAETGKIVLKWDAVNGAAQYQVSRATSEKGTYTVLGTVTDPTYMDNDAEAGKKYYYKVKALAEDSAADSAYSLVKARVCDLPQPEISVNLNTKGKPVVSWEKIEGAVSYQIYRSTEKDGTYKRIYTATKTQFINSGAADGVTYFYKVRAVCSNTSGNSALSDAKYAAAPLEAPEVSITLNAKGKPRLTWNKVDGAVKYQVYRATSPNGTYSLKYTTTGTGYANTGAAAGKTYYYKVRAVSDGTTASDSGFSEMVYINCSTVGISDCEAANEVIARINKWREYAELPALTWYDEGLDAAKIRAAELKVLPSDTERPDGSSPEDLWKDYGVAIELCLVTQPGVSGEDLVDAMMLDEELEDFGIVCLLDIWSGAVAARCGDYWIIMFVE